MTRNPRRVGGRDQRRDHFRRTRPPCWICGYPIDYDAPHHMMRTALVIDEAVPIKYGGSPVDPANTMPAHRCCNGWRGTKPVTLELRRRIRARYEREVLHITASDAEKRRVTAPSARKAPKVYESSF